MDAESILAEFIQYALDHEWKMGVHEAIRSHPLVRRDPDGYFPIPKEKIEYAARRFEHTWPRCEPVTYYYYIGDMKFWVTEKTQQTMVEISKDIVYHMLSRDRDTVSCVVIFDPDMNLRFIGGELLGGLERTREHEHDHKKPFSLPLRYFSPNDPFTIHCPEPGPCSNDPMLRPSGE